MLSVNNAANEWNSVQSFRDLEGVTYDIGKIRSLSRNTAKSSVCMEVDGVVIFVEISPTEAIHIIEKLG